MGKPIISPEMLDPEILQFKDEEFTLKMHSLMDDAAIGFVHYRKLLDFYMPMFGWEEFFKEVAEAGLYTEREEGDIEFQVNFGTHEIVLYTSEIDNGIRETVLGIYTAHLTQLPERASEQYAMIDRYGRILQRGTNRLLWRTVGIKQDGSLANLKEINYTVHEAKRRTLFTREWDESGKGSLEIVINNESLDMGRKYLTTLDVLDFFRSQLSAVYTVLGPKSILSSAVTLDCTLMEGSCYIQPLKNWDDSDIGSTIDFYT